MYFVNKEKLSRKLTYLKQLTEDYESVKNNHYAFERVAQMLIESSVDIGNMIIDAFILRDPGNYKDVIDILELEGAISKETKLHLHKTIEVRKQFVHLYDELNMAEVQPLFDEALPYYRQFIEEVVYFLENENVPVTAFGKGENAE
ncbi:MULTISPECIES: DUF86 domain-containing protein [Staphylococcus]|uniref:DUF86 domain-containing protein n=2 Tax=Staphylococcus chromogenes TaxID=46126 RepID=A0AAE5W8P5_STACR|nr:MULTISPECIES: DUF86 domain-containing protein [Staphylococcus]KDP13771.1 hypothetical protein SCHR_01330 [Staphylococcus chromogenes MU 970]MBP0045353.1 DUF86 domain-containing protein [Staphylococcus chromogenes]MBV5137598.1 DUF86 domain-containing protein [Staphylococcus chromogenes]MBV5191022.1 DUF86 domain-containing protein [Staphylococcus chromogenes]MBW3131737.1 DUF86 domain-containing protein [Staphylococcus chromogenes]